MKPLKYPCILFDFDGTLADSLGMAVEIFNSMSEDYGHRKILPEDIPRLREMSTSQCLRELKVSRFKLPRLLLEGRKRLLRSISDIRPVQGIEEMLLSLRPLAKTIGILTTNSRENVEVFLKLHRLEKNFDFISSTSKLTGKAKNIKAIMLTYGYGSKEMILVGDEVRDIKAAQKTNIASAAVSWGFHTPQLLQGRKPDFMLYHPSELHGFIR